MRLEGAKTEAMFEQLVLLETDTCVVWPFLRPSATYPFVCLGGRWIRAHRAALMRHVGPPSDPKLMACHTPGIGCQPLCVNYRHLRWGTKADNARDATIDGVVPKGERHPWAKLTEADVVAIRAARTTQRELASQFGVSGSVISEIRAFKSWKHVGQVGLS